MPLIDQLPFGWISCFPAWAGVWIFLLLSGYGIGYGFFTERYSLFQNSHLSLKLFLKFFFGRFIKIAPIYYIYCIFFEVLSGNYYFWNNWMSMIKVITFTFNGAGSISGVGHLWYVSMAMRLYLFMPFIYLILRKICRNKRTWIIVFSAVAIIGMAMRYVLYIKGCDWYTLIYTNCFMNLDLIILGMMISYIKVSMKIDMQHPYLTKTLVVLLFIVLVLYNCRIYDAGSLQDLFIYRVVLPTAYALNVTCLILSSDVRNGHRHIQFAEWMINQFSKYSYAFYILHIAVFNYLKSTLLMTNWYEALAAVGQYMVFFGASILIILALAIPLTSINGEISKKYKNIEKKVFG